MNYTVTHITEIVRAAPEYALLRFKGDKPIDGIPGQFAMIRGQWGTHPILPRAFSLVETGEEGAVLVRDVGEGTQLLCSMQPGDELSVIAPLGNGYEDPPNGEQAILVAGGVGVAPLILLANHLKSKGQETVFLYGARTNEHLPMMDEIAAVSDLFVTTEDGSVGEKGLITSPLRDALGANPRAIVYSCGPHGMLEAVARVAGEFGAQCQVALESPMACGVGTCKGCAVIKPDGSFTYVCSDGPVFNSNAIFGGAV